MDETSEITTPSKERTHHTEAKDVFISYRRQGGSTVARLLCDVINQRNITTFFDKNNLGEGDFDAAIIKNLQECRNIVLIVSPGMFGRGLDAVTGLYDTQKTEIDYVYREIKIALESGKPLIPIFVNGVTKFPSVLPPGIEDIAKRDALTLGHDNFDAELNKLIERLKTRKDLLIEEYLSAINEEYTAEILIDTCIDIGGINAENSINILLKNKTREILNAPTTSAENAIGAMLKELPIDTIKDICKNLEIDNTGDKKKLRGILRKWLESKEDGEDRFNEEKSSEDRFLEFIDTVSDYKKDNQSRLDAIKLASDLEIDIHSKKSSFDAYYAIFTEKGIEDFFNEKPDFYSSDEIKAIAYSLFGDTASAKNKKDLKEKIIAYVNYEFDTEETPEDIEK